MLMLSFGTLEVPSIAAAVDRLSISGGEIFVAAGTYQGLIVISKPLVRLICNATEKAIIKGQVGASKSQGHLLGTQNNSIPDIRTPEWDPLFTKLPGDLPRVRRRRPPQRLRAGCLVRWRRH